MKRIAGIPIAPGARRATVVVAGAALAVAFVGVRLGTAQGVVQEQAVATPAVPSGLAAGPSFADIVERVSPAVVNISVAQLARPTSAFGPRGPGGMPLEEFFGRFFEGPRGAPAPQRPRREGLGSGFVIDPAGYVVTNQHVVDGADEVVVTLQDGQKLEATLVGSDAKTDLALLKVDSANPLPAVEFGDSDRARVGEWVLAIGNPFGLGGTATAGIISARGRDIRSGPYDDYLQIDAPINSGNSGGPVFNTAGQVVGINTAIFSPTGGNIGIGFAIPANQARDVVEQLKVSGRVERGWLGVEIQALDAELAASLALESASGALVSQVVNDSPAASAGIDAGDVITRFGETPIESPKDLSRAVGNRPPGERTEVRIWRDGRERTVRVTLGETEETETTEAPVPGSRGPDPAAALGLVLRPLDAALRARFRIDSEVGGVLVVQVDPAGPAAAKGIRPGDVVTRIGQQDVATLAEAQAALNVPPDDEPVLLRVRRGDSQRFVSIGRG